MSDRDIIRVRLEVAPDPARAEAPKQHDTDKLNPAQRAIAESPMDRPAPTALTPSQRAAAPALFDPVRQSMRRRTTFGDRIEYAKASATDLEKAAPPGAVKNVESRLGMLGNALQARSGAAGGALSSAAGGASRTVMAGAQMLGGAKGAAMAASSLAAMAPIMASAQVFMGGANFLANGLTPIFAVYEAITGNKVGSSANEIANTAQYVISKISTAIRAADSAKAAIEKAHRLGGGFGRGYARTLEAGATLFWDYWEIFTRREQVKAIYDRDATADQWKSLSNQMSGRAGSPPPFW